MDNEQSHQHNIHGTWRISGSDKKVSGVFYPKEKTLVINGDLRIEQDLPIQEYTDSYGKKSRTKGFGSGRVRLEEDESHVIYGLSNNNKEITLFYNSEPFGSGSLETLPLFSESEWSITRYMYGKHIETDKLFYEAIINIENLNILANKNILTGTRECSSTGETSGSFSIKLEEEKIFSYNGIEGFIQYFYSSNFQGKIFIEPVCRLQIHSLAGFALSDIDGILARIYNLFMLLCEEKPIINDIDILTKVEYEKDGNKKFYNQKINYVLLNNRFIKNESEKMFPALENRNITMYTENIENDNVFRGIQDFFSKFEELNDPLTYYFASISNPLSSINTIFLNLVFGLEGFHRIAFGTKVIEDEKSIGLFIKKIKGFIKNNNESPLNKNQRQLFYNALSGAEHNELSARKKLEEIKAELFIDDSIITKDEIKKIIQQRDDLVHIRKDTLYNMDTKILFGLQQKLYLFFKYSILHHLGFGDVSITLPNSSDTQLSPQD